MNGRNWHLLDPLRRKREARQASQRQQPLNHRALVGVREDGTPVLDRKRAELRRMFKGIYSRRDAAILEAVGHPTVHQSSRVKVRPTGHGETTYVPVRQTNMLASEDDRDARRAVLLDRDRKRQQYIKGLAEALTEIALTSPRTARVQRHEAGTADPAKRKRGRLFKMRPTRSIRRPRR